ncbi:latent-transforming growth factor beta-binding protein 4-like [Sabethes cyaneus]|uniref:latent-transforming growth factor beta-binding protein 4-like n=1 Tax=Sabethes cyaneus TaxID=53552 RepID=UPI00237E23C1|nr:latent-transforming growth factor beta-binding protein 4-like [Sabethes cyaneus]
MSVVGRRLVFILASLLLLTRVTTSQIALWRVAAFNSGLRQAPESAPEQAPESVPLPEQAPEPAPELVPESGQEPELVPEPAPEQVPEQAPEQAPESELAPILEEATTTEQPPVETTTEEDNSIGSNVCSSGGSRAVCMDCNEISVCLNDRALPPKKCPVATPYCVDSQLGGYCSDEPDLERPECHDQFQCTSQGYFPDPFNCHYFYICDTNFRAYRQDCMPGYVYNVKINGCRRQIFPSDCESLDCSKSNGVWAYYGKSKQYYGYCYQSSSGSNEVALFKCSDSAEFDGFQCQYKCRSQGRFADSNDRSRYFECYYVGFKLTARVRTCGSGMAFDERTKFCVVQ